MHGNARECAYFGEEALKSFVLGLLLVFGERCEKVVKRSRGEGWAADWILGGLSVLR